MPCTSSSRSSRMSGDARMSSWVNSRGGVNSGGMERLLSVRCSPCPPLLADSVAQVPPNAGSTARPTTVPNHGRPRPEPALPLLAPPASVLHYLAVLLTDLAERGARH